MTLGNIPFGCFTQSTMLENYLDWILNIIKLTGLSLGTFILILFIFWIFINIIMVVLSELLPIFKGLLAILEYLLLPGSLMHMVWHVYALRKLNYTSEQIINFGWGWSRTGIKVVEQLKNIREGVIFFWAPIMNLPILILWIVPGMLLFQWLDSLIDKTVFYWIWLYVLLSLLLFGLPDLADFFAPLQISVIKVPEFYLFVVFYVIIAPITLVLWGWGITIIFSLVYAITSFYEIEKISKSETKRLSLSFNKYFSKKETTKPIVKRPIIIMTDPEKE